GGDANGATPARPCRPRRHPPEPYRVSIEKIVNSLTASGNAFVRRWQVGSDGWPIAVKVLDPARIVVQLDTWQETITGYTYNTRPLRTSQVLHIPLISDPGPLGQSPLDMIGTVIDDLAPPGPAPAGMYRPRHRRPGPPLRMGGQLLARRRHPAVRAHPSAKARRQP